MTDGGGKTPEESTGRSLVRLNSGAGILVEQQDGGRSGGPALVDPVTYKRQRPDLLCKGACPGTHGSLHTVSYITYLVRTNVYNLYFPLRVLSSVFTPVFPYLKHFRAESPVAPF